MSPLVSVIMPCYNMAAFIEEAVLSVVASDYRPLEIIVVDDGSTDNSLAIVSHLTEQHPELRLITQSNAGVAVARNHALREAQGKYILPVDADDKIAPSFVRLCVEQMEQYPDVKVVYSKAEFFGERTGEWQLPDYSPRLMARKNMIPATAMYRREDALAAGGYCETEIYREDWDFWLSMMEHGGRVVKLPETGLYYRIRSGSRRHISNEKKRYLVDAVNRRHPAFMQEQLGGPLHYHRSWSRFLNMFRSVHEEVPEFVGKDKAFCTWNEGNIIHAGRNTLRQTGDVVIKQFALPSLWRGLIYGLFAKSKARRSYEYAQRLGALTPQPLGFMEERYAGILHHSAYACRLSACSHTFNDLIGHPEFPNRSAILESIGRFTAQLHEQGVLHADYSGGNILFNDDGSLVQVIDLNRIHWKNHIDWKTGCKNLERLNIDRDALALLTKAYAQARHFDEESCLNYVLTHRWRKHIQQGITNLDI